MPYKSNDELPDAVKGALPAAAQSIYRNAFNSAESSGGDEGKAARIAWGAVKNAGWEKDADGNWMKKDNNTETFTLADVEIFESGKHNGDTYTDADIQGMADAFIALKDRIKPPLKFGHTPSIKGDGQPALGWVTGLTAKGSKLIATLSEVPKIVHDAIKAGRYKRVSAEIYKGFKDGEKKLSNVLAGVALLGADIPAVKTLEDLKAYFGDSSVDEYEGLVTYTMQVNERGEIENEEKDDMSEELKKYADETAKLKAELAAKEAEIVKFSEAESKRKRESATAELKTYCDTQVKAGVFSPAAVDAIVTKHGYSDEDGVFITFESFKAFGDAMGKAIDTDEKGETKSVKKLEYTDAGVEVDKRAKEAMAKNDKLTYSDAVRAVIVNDKELARKWGGL